MHDDCARTIVPVPAQVEINPSAERFKWPLGPASIFYCPEAQGIAEGLREALKARCSLASTVVSTLEFNGTCTVALRICSALPSLHGRLCRNEGYTLNIDTTGVVLCAEALPGLFYGVQSLLQLLPWGPCAGPLELKAMRITDYPAYRWRGMLLDVGRHMFSVPFIKKLLDLLALHKLNRFHWHLTEDQGWRIEIRALPLLTERGAFRGSGPDRYGGFFTQQDIRDVVAYAAARFIEVVPEIELPGHCRAALACYPELSCAGRPSDVPTQWGVQTEVYCAGNDETFAFLERVLEEVVQLFPYEFVHIGGDECPKVCWAACPKCQRRIREEGLAGEAALQAWFISRIARFLAARGRRIIGWDEVLEGEIPRDAAIMSWRGTSGGVAAAKLKHQVIMCPNNKCYFDYRQSSSIQEPGTWYAVLPIEWVYSFEPRGALFGSDIPAAAPNGAPGSSFTAFVPSVPQGTAQLSSQAPEVASDDMADAECGSKCSIEVDVDAPAGPPDSARRMSSRAMSLTGGSVAASMAASDDGGGRDPDGGPGPGGGHDPGGAEGSAHMDAVLQRDDADDSGRMGMESGPLGGVDLSLSGDLPPQPGSAPTTAPGHCVSSLADGQCAPAAIAGAAGDGAPAVSVGGDALMADSESVGANGGGGCAQDPNTHRLTAEDEQFIIGGQANLWTEFIADEATAEYMLLPRLSAFAECVWSPPQSKNWRSFTARAAVMLERLRYAGYNFRPLSATTPASTTATPSQTPVSGC